MTMRKKCLNCGRSLDDCDRADNPGARAQMKWCSVECKQHYKNRAYYALHRDEVRARTARADELCERAGDRMNLATFLVILAVCNLPALVLAYAAICMSSRISRSEEQQERHE